jgi:hypothetical protein
MNRKSESFHVPPDLEKVMRDLPDINETLAERGKTHGDWPVQAEVADYIISTIAGKMNRDSDIWWHMTPSQRQAITLIATKLARIACGNPHEVDHWHDIAGYATLAAEEIRSRQK